jgi:hypothetical protein
MMMESDTDATAGDTKDSNGGEGEGAGAAL